MAEFHARHEDRLDAAFVANLFLVAPVRRMSA